MAGRNLGEWVSDQLLLLYVIENAAERRRLHITRIHKILFLTELETWSKGFGGLDYAFIRLKRGPFSNEVRGDLERLHKRNIVRRYHNNRAFKLKKEGRDILREAEPFFTKNKHIFPMIEKNLDYVMEFPFVSSLLEIIYEMPNPIYPEMTIRETPQGKYLLKRQKKPQVIKPFVMTEEEAESFEIILDPNMWRDYLLAEKSVQEEPLTHWRNSPLFS